MGYVDSVLALSPLAYYRMTESAGTTLVDSSNNARHGTYSNSPAFGTASIPGTLGETAATFNGSSQYASVPYASWMDAAQPGVVLWFKTTSSNSAGAALANRWSASGSDILYIDVATDAWRGWQTIAGTRRTNAPTVTGKSNGVWHMVATWYDGAAVNFQIDGVKLGSVAATGAALTGAEPLRIAARQSTSLESFYNGSFGHLSYHNALTDAQVANLYTVGSTPIFTGSWGAF